MRKKLIISTIITLFLCTCFFSLNTEQASASSSYDKVDSGTLLFLNKGKSAKIPFKLSSKKHVMLIVKPQRSFGSGKIKSGKLVLKIKKKNGKTVEKYSISLKGVKLSEDEWAYCDTDKQLKKGSYYCTVTNTSDTSLFVKYYVRSYKKKATKASIKKRSVYRGNWVKIGKIKGGMPVYKSIKAADKRILTYLYADYNGNIYGYGKKAGQTTVTITLAGGKRYSTTITVKPKYMNVYAFLYDYNTRDNYFRVKIKNESDRTVTVIRSGGKAINVKYKSFDRYFKNMSSVQIKPGKTKYVRFYCSGSTTWDDYTQFTVFAKLRIEGKTYEWHVWDEDSVYKNGKKWYSTYWSADESAYEDWNVNIETDDDDDEDYDDEDYDDEDYDYDYDY